MIRKSTLILIIILLFIFNKTLSANEKQKITGNFNSIDTLKFDFNQISHDKKESGKCFLKFHVAFNILATFSISSSFIIYRIPTFATSDISFK